MPADHPTYGSVPLTIDAVAAWVASPEGQAAMGAAREKSARIIAALDKAREYRPPCPECARKDAEIERLRTALDRIADGCTCRRSDPYAIGQCSCQTTIAARALQGDTP